MGIHIFGGDKKSSNNGHAALAKAPDVPIIGQPFKISGWQIAVVLTCNCKPGNPALLVTNTGGTPCPGCGKGYVIQGVQAAGQQAHFSIGAMLLDQEPSKEPSDV